MQTVPQISSCFKISNTRLLALQCDTRARTKIQLSIHQNTLFQAKNHFSEEGPSLLFPGCRGTPSPYLTPRLLDPPRVPTASSHIYAHECGMYSSQTGKSTVKYSLNRPFSCVHLNISEYAQNLPDELTY